jgi:hypothetical protein
MNSPEQHVALPIDYASELAMEMHLMRAECCDAAEGLMEDHPVDEVGLEECAILDEALARAQSLLLQAVGTIKHLRGGRG